MNHNFNPTILREYDIRGIVGDTLTEDDAYALGRTFASKAHGEGARTIAVGRDGRTHSGMLEAELIRGLTEGGMSVVQIDMGPSPMLYFATHYLDVDGGIMVTGSHNPADYNGFKLLLKGRSVFGAEIQEIGERAASGHWHEGSGTIEEVDIREAYADRLLQDFSGKPLPYRLGRWQRRRGADPRHARRPPARPSSRNLQPGRRHLPQPPSRSHGRGQSRRPQSAGRARAARFRNRLRRRRRPHRRGRRLGPRDLGRPADADPGRVGAQGAARSDHHRRRQGEPGAVRRHRCARRQAAHVEDRPQPDQVEDEADRRAARGRDERPHLLRAPLVRLRRRALRGRAADRGSQRERQEPDRDHGRDAQERRDARAALRGRRSRASSRSSRKSAAASPPTARRSTRPTACASAPTAAGGCCARRTRRTCWSRGRRQRTRPESSGWSPRSTISWRNQA